MFIKSWYNRKKYIHQQVIKHLMTQKKIQRKITRFCVQKLDIDSPISIDISAEKYIKEIEENVKKNRVLKNSFLGTESKKDSIGVHIIHTENKLIKEILKYQGISELKSII